MNNDREILENAAFAAGMLVLREGVKWPDEKVGWFFCMQHGIAGLHNRDGIKPWIPLHEDGDSLRLAVKMGMELDLPIKTPDIVGACIRRGDNVISVSEWVEEFSDKDLDVDFQMEKIVRKVIVKCAAEFGEWLLSNADLVLKTPNKFRPEEVEIARAIIAKT